MRLACWLLALAAGLLGAILPAAAQQAGAADTLALSAEERDWIAAHPVVRFSGSSGIPPYYEFDEGSSRPHGFVIEVLDLLAQRSGLRFEYKRHPSFRQALDAVRRGEAEALPFVSPSRVRKDEFLHLRSMISANLVLAVRRDIPDISPASNFGGYRVAVQAESAADLLMAERFPLVRTLRYDKPEEALRAVASGDADIFIGYRHVAVHYVEKHLMANVQIRGTLGPGLTEVGPAVRRDLPMLHRILDKAMASVTQREYAQLAQRWLPAGAAEAEGPRQALLTDAEREWVNARGRIRVAYDAAFAPITFQTDLTQMRGLGADFMRLAAGKAGLSITSETGSSFAEAYRRGTRGEIDVLVGAARTFERRADFDFVGPFLRVPTGIVTRSTGGLLVTKLDEVTRLKLALLDEHFLIPQLRARHPTLTLLTFPTQDAVLQSVAEGRADLAIGNLKVVNQLIDDHYIGRLRMTGTVPEAESELYFAVRSDLPELSRLLRKGLDAVGEEESREIERRWLTVELKPGIGRGDVLRVGGVVLAFILLLLAYLYLLRRGNRRLRNARQIERDARRLAEDTTAARGRFLSYLTHELRGTIGAIAAGAQMLKQDLPPENRDRLADAINASAEGFLVLLESTLQYEHQFDRAVVLRPEAVDLQALWPKLLAPLELAAQSKGLALSSDLQVEPGASTVVPVDAQRLRQVINNLAGNAIKFTPDGTVKVTGRLTSGAFELEVCDNGPGLSADDIERLFQPYAQGVQGLRLRQGAGLGLAITRQIVDAMGGQVGADPTAPGGARFIVTLPWVVPVVPA